MRQFQYAKCSQNFTREEKRQQLRSWFLTFSAFEPKHSLKNSFDLTERLKGLHIPPCARLVSFDVKSMYTCIPVPETINWYYVRSSFKTIY